MLDLELVLPCYNEALSLPHLLARAKAAAIASGFSEGQFQLVLVENGSSDHSRDVITELAKGPDARWFRVVYIDKNQGYGYGLHQGLLSTTAPVIAWSHADQQCDPADVFRAYSVLKSKESGASVLVKGFRYGRNGRDKLVSYVFEILASLILGKRFTEINAQPKVFHRSLLNYVKNPPVNFAYDLYVLYQAHRARFLFATIDVKFPPRIHGLSNWSANFFSRYKTILNMIRYMWTLAKTEGRL